MAAAAAHCGARLLQRVAEEKLEGVGGWLMEEGSETE